MLKAELRKTFLEKRRALTETEVNERTLLIVQNFLQHIPLKGIRKIHIFLPIRKHNEVNTFLIIDKLRNAIPDLEVIIPRMSESDGEMDHFKLNQDTQLTENSWGIPEPLDANHCNDIPDVIFIPLLAFDFEGNRVGYGKGYYDRYLYTLPANVLKIGISLFPPVEQIEDTDEFDIPLDYCITTQLVYDFTK